MHHSSSNTRSTSNPNKMKALKQFPEDFGEPYVTSFHFMNKSNVRYLEEDRSFVKRNWRFIFIIPAALIQVTALGTQMAVLLKKQDMIQFASMLPPFLVEVQTLLKASALIPKTSKLSSFIRELGSLWRTKFTESQNKLKNARLSRLNLCNRVYYYVTTFGSLQYLLSPLLETLFRRYILQQDSELLLPAASSYPFNPTKNWLIYLLVYIFQFHTMFLLSYIYIGCELILITSCALLGIEFLMLNEDLSEVQSDTEVNEEIDCERQKTALKEFVMRHQKLIRLCQQLDSVFNRMIFIDLLFVGMTTCAFSFAGNFANGPLNMWINYVGQASSLTCVFFVCYYGDLLTAASAEISNRVYNTIWYKGDKQYAKAIWLIIKISQKPCCITSLKYSVVSLNMFSKVVSTTWSYFSLMNTAYSEE